MEVISWTLEDGELQLITDQGTLKFSGVDAVDYQNTGYDTALVQEINVALIDITEMDNVRFLGLLAEKSNEEANAEPEEDLGMTDEKFRLLLELKLQS